MKTNVKNGAFVLNYLAVDDATIHIGRGEKESRSYLPFETRADGEYLVIAETNEKGIVKRLVIDFPEHVTEVAEFLEKKVTEIDSADIIIAEE